MLGYCILSRDRNVCKGDNQESILVKENNFVRRERDHCEEEKESQYIGSRVIKDNQ